MTMQWRDCWARRCLCASSMNRRRAFSPAFSEADHMGLLALFRRTPPSASVAKERLRIIVAQERNARSGGPDYLPLLRRELLEVIRKYVKVEPDAIQVHLDREDGQEVLE